MTPTADLMKLVEKWRELAETPDLIAWTTRHSLRRCADELAAALSSTGEARVGGEVVIGARVQHIVGTDFDNSCIREGDAGTVVQLDPEDGTALVKWDWPDSPDDGEWWIMTDSIRPLATPAQPKASEDYGQHDIAAWELIRIAESCGAVKDEGEDGMFWTLTLDAFFDLEARMRDAVNAMRFAEAGNHPKASEGKAGGKVNWALVAEGLDYFEKAGDDGDKLYVAELRKAIATLTAPGADDGQ